MSLKVELGRHRDAKRARQRRGLTRSAAKKGRGGTVFALLFFSLFFLAGSAFMYFVFVRPVTKSIASGGWPTVPCEIVRSEVDSHSDSDGTTYSIEIEFRYRYQDRVYTGGRYEFMDMNSSGRSGKQRVVSNYPVGSEAMCYVNPDDPQEAVLHRGLSNNMWFALIPLVFMLVGGGGIVGTLISIGKRSWATGSAKNVSGKAPADRGWWPNLVKQLEAQGGPDAVRNRSETVLPTKSRLGKLLGLLIFTIIWDSITAVVIVVMLKDGDTPIFALVILGVFALVGVGMIAGVVQQALALANPVVALTFSPRVVELGQPLEISWQINGRTDRLRRLTFTLEGVERATYTRGTDTYTDEHVFTSFLLYEYNNETGRDPVAIDGQVSYPVPIDTMHSMDASNNDIVWRIQVHGDIPKWPDVKDTYDFAVVPPNYGTAKRGMF